eukprot:353694-Chlamydomonas_euryale.AAC.4
MVILSLPSCQGNNQCPALLPSKSGRLIAVRIRIRIRIRAGSLQSAKHHLEAAAVVFDRRPHSGPLALIQPGYSTYTARKQHLYSHDTTLTQPG